MQLGSVQLARRSFWVSAWLFSLAFSSRFSRARISSSHDSRWDISRTAVAWVAAAVAAMVSFWGLLNLGRRS